MDSKEESVVEEIEEEVESEEDLLGEEIRLGGTQLGWQPMKLFEQCHESRSFLIYDSRNEAIRGFLQYQRTMSAALSEYGEMVLEIRPFEMVRGVEIVYLERDRERSLRFVFFVMVFVVLRLIRMCNGKSSYVF